MKNNNKHENNSDSSEDDDDSDQSRQLDTNNAPKLIPVARLPDRLKTKKIIINISDTQYPIVQEIAEEMGWIIQHTEGYGDWDIWWTDRQITPDTLFKMNFHQKINHYPGIYELARKNLLGLNLMAMKQKFQEQYSFFPDTWIIPIQFSQFRNFYESVEVGKTRTYIVKPEALSQGRGIFLTRNIEDIMTGYKYVVQRYIKNPFLIDGLKFDLRIYVLLAGTQPLRLYIYEDGLARFATERYQEPTFENLGKSFVHLTNYSLNKSNPKYIYNKSEKDVGIGHKRTLKAVYEQIQKLGYNVQELKAKINDIIVKTVISGLPTIAHQYRYSQPEQYENNMCFHLLGFDVMLTNKLQPILIEINHTPSFQTSTPLDYMVKKNLIRDALNIMRIKSQNKKTLFEKAKIVIKKRIETGKREIVKGKQRQILLEKAQAKRDKEEEGLLGGFTKIHPTDSEQMNQKYMEMLKRSEEVHKSTDEARKKLIKEEQQKFKNITREKKEEEKKKQKKAKKKKEKEKQKEKILSEKKAEKTQKTEKLQTFQNFSIKEEIQYELVDKKEELTQSKMEDFSSKTLNFRKAKKNLQPITPAQQLMRFSQIMMQIISKKQTKSQKVKEEQAYFCKAQESVLKRSKGSLAPITMMKDKEMLQKGNFVKPKTYQIAYNRSYKVMDLQTKLREGIDLFQTSRSKTKELEKHEKELLDKQITKNVYKKRKKMSLV